MEKSQGPVTIGRSTAGAGAPEGGRHVASCSLAIALSACGSGGTSSKAKNEPTTTAVQGPPEGHLARRGRHRRPIKLGIALVDFDCIKQYTDTIRLGQQAVYEAFIKDINDKGGIAGRKIVPVFKKYCPLGNAQILTLLHRRSPRTTTCSR